MELCFIWDSQSLQEDSQEPNVRVPRTLVVQSRGKTLMTVQLLNEHHLEFLNLKGGCTGSSESTLVKIPHCWKSHVVAHFRSCHIILQ